MGTKMNKELFIEHLKELNIELNEEQLFQLDKYYKLMIETNKVMNLTGITKEEDVYLKHFYDSLTICKVIKLNDYNTLCDIGTGAGFPGLVLKIVFPNLNVTLVDSLAKRTTFLQNVVEELALNKIEIITERMEAFSKINREKFDIVTARAVAKLNILLELSMPAINVNGYFIPLKGNVDKEELKLDNCLKKLNCTLTKNIEFKLPVEESKRTILVFKKNKETHSIYPRGYDQIKKNGL